MPADLHVHTTFSDSTQTPEEVIERCVVKGVATVAITDHDSVQGVPRATAAGQEVGVRVVPGVEMTAYDKSTEIHVVGLFIDPRNRELTRVIDDSREVRHTRVHQIVDRLRRVNVNLSADDVFEIADGGSPGRMHVAQALVRNGYTASVADAFKRYIGNRGPAYVPKQKLTPAEAAAAIHQGGGVAIVGHPGIGVPDAMIRRMIDEGMDGIEVYHPLHSDRHVDHYLRLAWECGARVSGGSDSHGNAKEGTQVGNILVNDEIVRQLELGAEQIRRGE